MKGLRKIQIILIAGSAQNGKDSIGKIIKELYPEKTLIVHFADYLKYICSQYLDWDGKKDEAGRQLLQQWGTNYVRNQYDRDFWAKSALRIVELFSNKYKYFVLPDWRFPNESQIFIKAYGDLVKCVKVTRPGFDNGLTEEQKNHESETALDKYHMDYYIENSGSLEELKEAVKMMMFIQKHV